MVYTIIIGALSGWLAGVIRQGYGFGIWGNIVVGIIGAFLGDWIFEQINVRIGSGVVNDIATGVIGALVLLFLIGLVRKK
ncbi:MAG: GlsB/YeaQ/YmgE family stress response membrane protein [Saprospiraceae bacterium]